MRVIIGAEALAHLDGIFDWIAKDDPAAATRVVGRIFDDLERLSEFPHIGHVGREEGTFEWVVPGLPYIIIY